ncbi:AbrB/MazE/SpoVT family DNA-binding domain-containing protein [Candidatus Woesearchaeota archaeon]|nr:AbrB/MazE/SpoVT family DNA-binding domain-containing protein [Candidatus Woesearchaeota archaeon]MCF7900912.1 AbrB/MazE/SpoVT family DNA-binding domain-containing protein [Candidatus Woesearchaeota archaeon]MCF8013039.1 AbrB/MazE/SpoVT family DNA-binding domain-containing protein [Candidatus Woesearchaeota archaeon]
MLITKLSSKGQIVIPKEARKDLNSGTAFSVMRKKDMIVLKKVEGYTKQELKEMEELDKIWEDIRAGKYSEFDSKDFLKEMNSW